VLHIAISRGVPIRAKRFGFVALVFAGLIIDLSASFTGHSLAWPVSPRPIFGLLALGATGLG
jgi:hypothetical protein